MPGLVMNGTECRSQTMHPTESAMNDYSEQRTITEVRQRESYKRASTVHVTMKKPLCQMWIDFEERTRDLHIASHPFWV